MRKLQGTGNAIMASYWLSEISNATKTQWINCVLDTLLKYFSNIFSLRDVTVRAPYRAHTCYYTKGQGHRQTVHDTPVYLFFLPWAIISWEWQSLCNIHHCTLWSFFVPRFIKIPNKNERVSEDKKMPKERVKSRSKTPLKIIRHGSPYDMHINTTWPFFVPSFIKIPLEVEEESQRKCWGFWF
jgi:hypothetical protein